MIVHYVVLVYQSWCIKVYQKAWLEHDQKKVNRFHGEGRRQSHTSNFNKILPLMFRLLLLLMCFCAFGLKRQD